MGIATIGNDGIRLSERLVSLLRSASQSGSGIQAFHTHIYQTLASSFRKGTNPVNPSGQGKKPSKTSKNTSSITGTPKGATSTSASLKTGYGHGNAGGNRNLGDRTGYNSGLASGSLRKHQDSKTAFSLSSLGLENRFPTIIPEAYNHCESRSVEELSKRFGAVKKGTTSV